ncbi:hypothetical protein Ctha_0615 [Chloroherpeton thalassium ATCC 35110]|uniref:Uncharacterized protein n=1 Tax=Chloroherpeton thalassium (strain ATCC 35110 / GB-78) TaxID=517418 RepID=B3QVM8_CHLT3|nr:hypothetical protein Ctha_0615 [Chloroherpeton thalassium ATCC 35110]
MPDRCFPLFNQSYNKQNKPILVFSRQCVYALMHKQVRNVILNRTVFYIQALERTSVKTKEEK